MKTKLLALVIASAAQADPWAEIEWDGGVGGISAIELSADGHEFIALSDRGWIIEGTATRAADGRLSALQGGAPQRFSKKQRDIEGLSLGADGVLFVSTEGPATVLRRDSADGKTTDLGAPQGNWFGINRGIEALASDPQPIILSERGGNDMPVWRLGPQGWAEIARIDIPTHLAPVGADMGPDGRLYLLERGISGLGFVSRLRRIDLETGAAETVLEFPSGTHGNLEGLSIWRHNGALIATMVSDDNQLFFQSSAVVEYRLPD